MQYSQLDDCKMFEPGNAIEVWYARNPSFDTSSTLDVDNLEQTHAHVGSIGGIVGVSNITLTDLLDRLFGAMQGECWSPKGEARTLIQSKGLSHTSLSVGDVICFKSKTQTIVYRCKPIGWERF